MVHGCRRRPARRGILAPFGVSALAGAGAVGIQHRQGVSLRHAQDLSGVSHPQLAVIRRAAADGELRVSEGLVESARAEHSLNERFLLGAETLRTWRLCHE